VILAAGLSPAWQYVLLFDRLRSGEVNRARTSHWFASGKAINVGLALHHLEATVRTVSPYGGTTGAQLVADFEATGTQARWVKTEGATRICTTLIERGSGTTTELVENATAITPAELAAFETAFAEEAAGADVVVFSGSLPAGVSRDLYRRLILSSPGCKALDAIDGFTRMVLDLRGPELLHCLPFRPFLVKPNREELSMTVDQQLDSDSDLLNAMRGLNQRGAQWVLVTSGGDAAWLTSSSETYRIVPPSDVKVVNPIGCGDSVAAGVACGLHQEMEPLECVRLGFGAAAANLERMTSARFAQKRAIELAGRVQVHNE
jgi:1-phosphofructokinase family hexose kinase